MCACVCSSFVFGHSLPLQKIKKGERKKTFFVSTSPVTEFDECKYALGMADGHTPIPRLTSSMQMQFPMKLNTSPSNLILLTYPFHNMESRKDTGGG